MRATIIATDPLAGNSRECAFTRPERRISLHRPSGGACILVKEIYTPFYKHLVIYSYTRITYEVG